MKENKNIMIISNSVVGLLNFRKELIVRLRELGFNVIIVAPVERNNSFLNNLGCRVINSKLSRRGTNPFNDLSLVLQYIKILRVEKPDIVLTYTIKPNVYGGIASQILKVPYLANITGLGTSIENRGIIRHISLLLYKLSLRKAKYIMFQNRANLNLFLDMNIVNKNISCLLPGSGVNLKEHFLEPYPVNQNIIKFLFIGRIMKEKGIRELLDSVVSINKKYENIEFNIVGPPEDETIELVEKLHINGEIKYHGKQNNVHKFIKESHAVINPSYHEGMSNVLLEAASTGRPLLASSVPGCIETFEDGITGLAFYPKDVMSLTRAIEEFIDLPLKSKEEMGILGRKKMEKEFDRNIVVQIYLDKINEILQDLHD